MESKIPVCTPAHILRPTVRFEVFRDISVCYKHNLCKT